MYPLFTTKDWPVIRNVCVLLCCKILLVFYCTYYIVLYGIVVNFVWIKFLWISLSYLYQEFIKYIYYELLLIHDILY